MSIGKIINKRKKVVMEDKKTLKKAYVESVMLNSSESSLQKNLQNYKFLLKCIDDLYTSYKIIVKTKIDKDTKDSILDLNVSTHNQLFEKSSRNDKIKLVALYKKKLMTILKNCKDL